MKYIEIKGEKYPVALDILTFEEFAEEIGVTIEGIDEAMRGPRQIRNTVTLLRLMIESGAAAAGDTIELTDKQLAAKIGMDTEPIERAMSILIDFMPAPAADENDTSKKKTTRRKAKS